MRVVKPFSLAFLVISLSVATSQAVTTLPVGPFTFTTNADYDNNFKEGTNGALIATGASGYLGVTSPVGASAFGSAIYDTSVTPGTGGNGGTGGTNANNDLSNFTVSSLIQFQNRATTATAGYFIRMNDDETSGYLATATFFNTAAPLQVRFDLYKGVGLDYNPAAGGVGSFATIALDFTTSAAANFNFSVTAVGDSFSFFLSNAGNTASVSHTFTDAGTTVLTGQTGIFLRASQQTSATSTTRMDNFTITTPIPEPSSALLLGSAASLLLLRRRKA